VLLILYYAHDLIKKNDLSGACGKHGREMHTGFWWGILEKRGLLEIPTHRCYNVTVVITVLSSQKCPAFNFLFSFRHKGPN
jgi:hypothetical protein